MRVLIPKSEKTISSPFFSVERGKTDTVLKRIMVNMIVLLFLLLNYGSYWMFLHKLSKEATFIFPFILSVGIFLGSLFKRGYVSLKRVLIVSGMIVCILLSCVFNNDFSTDNFLLIVSIITAFMIVEGVKGGRIINSYVQVMIFLAIYSLIATYIILPLCLHGVINFLPIYINAERPYYDMGLAMCLGYYGVPRNSGFCREPGVYQIYLILVAYLLIETFPKSKKNIVCSMIIAITLLTTFSAVAYLCFAIILVLILKKYVKNTRIAIKSCLLILMCLGGMFFAFWSNQSVRDELRRTFGKWLSMESESTQVRFSGIFLNIELFFEKPILGYGLVNSWLEIIQRTGLQDVTGTPLIAFSGFGILFGGITNLLLFRFCKTKYNMNTLMWWTAIFISFSSQNVILSFVFWIVLFLDNNFSEVVNIKKYRVNESGKSIGLYSDN